MRSGSGRAQVGSGVEDAGLVKVVTTATGQAWSIAGLLVLLRQDFASLFVIPSVGRCFPTVQRAGGPNSVRVKYWSLCGKPDTYDTYKILRKHGKTAQHQELNPRLHGRAFLGRLKHPLVLLFLRRSPFPRQSSRCTTKKSNINLAICFY